MRWGEAQARGLDFFLPKSLLAATGAVVVVVVVLYHPETRKLDIGSNVKLSIRHTSE